MKKLIVLLISIVFICSTFAQKTTPVQGKVAPKTATNQANKTTTPAAVATKAITITGKVEGYAEGKIYLSKVGAPTIVKLDSVDVANGAFTFTNGITNNDIYMINFGKSRSGIYIYPENSNILLTVKLNAGIIDNSDVKSGPIQQTYQEYMKAVKDANVEMNKLYASYQTARKDSNKTEIARLEKELDVKSDAMDATETKLQELNASNLLGIFLINRKIYAYDYEKLKGCLAKVNPVAQKSEVFKSLSARLTKMEKVKVGAIAPDFTLPNPDGKMISLSQFRGKVVVVDCWASWCGPCRAESPNMVALWNANKDKNFTILGVSLDQPTGREKWLKAIADDKLAWNQVSDLKYWQSMICDLYVINAIPETILIDKDGKIIARGLRGEELKAKVADLLK